MTTHISSIPLSRRQLLRSAACGFGGLALNGILAGAAPAAAASPLAVRNPHYAPRAKRIIFLFMAGGPSQADLFDPKPYIGKNHGKVISPPVNDGQLRVGVPKFLAMGPVAPVRPRGQSGMMMSDLLPNLAGVADELCLLRAVQADNKAHAPAALQFHTGHIAEARPSMGAWISYGLGTENEDLPSFITIHPPDEVRTYGSSFLPAIHQGTPLRAPTKDGDAAIEHLRDPGANPDGQLRRLNFLQQANRRLLDRFKTDAQMEGIIESFELAFRMQTETPGLVDLADESEETLALYGIGDKQTDRNGRACLLARRFSEAGVRFLQVTMGGWDRHGQIRDALPKSCGAADKPIAGLLTDLKRRGLLEDTLVVWSGEFGRSPWSQDLSGTSPIEKHGREHQQESFCAWLAGGGVKPGVIHGATDDHGYLPVSGKVHLHDLHATLLHLLGLDHTRLTRRHGGRDFRLTDVFGNVVTDILA